MFVTVAGMDRDALTRKQRRATPAGRGTELAAEVELGETSVEGAFRRLGNGVGAELPEGLRWDPTSGLRLYTLRPVIDLPTATERGSAMSPDADAELRTVGVCLEGTQGGAQSEEVGALDPLPCRQCPHVWPLGVSAGAPGIRSHRSWGGCGQVPLQQLQEGLVHGQCLYVWTATVEMVLHLWGRPGPWL